MIEEKTAVANPLIIARNRAGANTPEGQLYSRMIETDLAYREERDPGARAHLREFMGWCRDRLAGLRDVQ